MQAASTPEPTPQPASGGPAAAGADAGAPWQLLHANQMGETRLYAEPSSGSTPLYIAGVCRACAICTPPSAACHCLNVETCSP